MEGYSHSLVDQIHPWMNPLSCFKRGYLLRIIITFSIFAVSLVLNSHFAVYLYHRYRRRKFSRIKLLMGHLLLSDLLITLFNIPALIAWNTTVDFNGGTFLCKFVEFFRQFTYASSSFLVVVISIDRFNAMVFPLSSMSNADRQCVRMITIAWICSAIYAFPNILIYDIIEYKLPPFYQCFDIHFLRDPSDILSENSLWYFYFLYKVLLHYLLPFLANSFCYLYIIYIITSRGSKRFKAGRMMATHCSVAAIQRPKTSILYLSLAMTIGFIVSWTPCYMLWSYTRVIQLRGRYYESPEWISCLITGFEYINVCLDPIIYGFCSIKKTKRYRNIKFSN